MENIAPIQIAEPKREKRAAVERYFTSRYKKPGIKRGDKVKPTKEQQAKGRSAGYCFASCKGRVSRALH